MLSSGFIFHFAQFPFFAMSVQERILAYLNAHPEGAATETLYQELKREGELRSTFFHVIMDLQHMFYLRLPFEAKLCFITERGKVKLEQLEHDRNIKLESGEERVSQLDRIEQKLDRIEQLVQAIADRVLKSDQN